MKEHDLLSIAAKKYNPWCERRALVCADQARHKRASRYFTQPDLAPSERAAFFLHELTGCEGLEFVAFSSVKLMGPVELPSEVVLVPCFLPETEGESVQDQLVQLTMKMHQESRFVYDGWVPIAVWDEESVRKSVRGVDEALAIFCLRGRAVFDWEPKYPAPSEPSSVYMFDDQHLQELEAMVGSLGSLPEADRVAVYRSIAWLSQGLRLNEPMARFLFSILAIESLATYIEQKATEDSPLVVLRKTHFTETEQRTCIEDTLADWLQTDPRRAIERAYFDCVMSITRRLKTHLANVLRCDPQAYALLFEKKVRGKTLYEMRHPIAHGSLDALDEKQREEVQLRVWDAERIARQYIRTVLEAALGARFPSASVSAGFFLDMQNVVVSSERMYRGPRHMAEIYG